MLKNTTLYLFRHAEKPEEENDRSLSHEGHARAHAYIAALPLLQERTNKKRPIGRIFASKPSKESKRPLQTVLPLAQHLDLVVNVDYKDKDYKRLVKFLHDSQKAKDQTILICWHHGKLLELAKHLGFPAENLPEKWPEDVFGWLLSLHFDEKGHVSASDLRNMSVMFNDYGKDPPADLSLSSVVDAKKTAETKPKAIAKPKTTVKPKVVAKPKATATPKVAVKAPVATRPKTLVKTTTRPQT